MKYLICGFPMLFGVELISWLCLFVIVVFALIDLAKAVDKEKGARDW